MVKFILTNSTYSIIGSNSTVPLFVGYGTSNPRYTLEIVGNVNVSGSIYNNGLPFSGGGGGGTTYWNLNGSNIYFTAGNVGIGSSSPTVKLDLNKIRMDTGIRIARTNDVIPNGVIGSTNNTLQLQNNLNKIECSSNAISLYMNDVEQVRVNSNGWLAIGTKYPLQKLHIEGSYMSSQSVGVGTTLPSAQLHLYSSSTSNNYYRTTGILMENTTVGEVGISFYNSNYRLSGNSWNMGMDLSGTRLDMTFGLQTVQFQNSSVKLSLLNSGYIGIGTTNAGSFGLSVNGSLYVSSNTYIGNYAIPNILDVQGVHLTATSAVPYLTLNSTNSANFLSYVSKTITYQTNSWWIGSTTLAYSSNNSLPASANAYYLGCTLLNDGRVVFIPYYSASFDIYNPYTNVFTRNANLIGSPSASYAGGVVLPDGRVVCTPHYSGNVGIYNPVTDTLATVGTFIGSGAYIGAILVPDGRVLFTPYNNNNIGVYTPSANTFTTIAISSSGFYKFAGSVLTANGLVIFVPYDADHIGIFNPSTNGYSTVVTTQGAGNSLYYGGVLLPNGRVLFVPYNSTSFAIYDPYTNAYVLRTGAPGSAAYQGGVLTSDNRVLFMPYGTSTYYGVYNIATDTYSTFNFGGTKNLSGSTFSGGVLTSEGTVVCAPYYGGEIGIVSLFPRAPLDFCLHPCFNKF